jgi:OmpA-OmpF porin, OOP family
LLRGPAGTIDSKLTLRNRDGRVTYSGLVRDEATQSAIVNTLRATFGDRNVTGDLRVDRNVRHARWQSRLGDLSSALKTPGVELSLTGDAINVGGWVTTADRLVIMDRLRVIFGAQATIRSLPDAAAEAVRNANDKAVSALVALGTSGVTPDAAVQAMNLAVINFSTGSAEIPPDGVDVIRKAGPAIKEAASNDLKIEIGGHTDNTGEPARNIALSQARADAVKVALTVAGAPEEILITRGYGDTRPRATNETEFGRFQNRRIEYTIVRGASVDARATKVTR